MTASDLITRPPAAAPTPATPPSRLHNRTPRWKDALVSLSLANLCFLHIWAATPPFLSEEGLVLLQRPGLPSAHYFALFINITVLAIGEFALLRCCVPTGRPFLQIARRTCFTVLALLALNSVRMIFTPHLRLLQLDFWMVKSRVTLFLLCAPLALMILFLLLRQTRVKLVTTLRSVLIALSPLFPISLFATGVHLHKSVNAPVSRITRFHHPGPVDSQSGVNRVAFLLFDELDEDLLFDKRPHGLRLPNFDRLRASSVRVTGLECSEPRTLYSVPEITTGKRVSGVRVILDGGIELELQGARNVIALGRAGNIFSHASGLGIRSAVVGWYLPYCEIFRASLASCASYPASFVGLPSPDTYGAALAEQWRFVLNWRPFRQFLPLQPPTLEDHLRTLDSFRQDALRSLSDPSIGFVFLHLPVPHAPFFYNASTRRFVETMREKTSYSDGLIYADQLLGDILAELNKSGLAKSTTLVVASDHSLRMGAPARSARRIPLLISAASWGSGLVRTTPQPHTSIRTMLEFLLSDQRCSAPETCLRLWPGSSWLPD